MYICKEWISIHLCILGECDTWIFRSLHHYFFTTCSFRNKDGYSSLAKDRECDIDFAVALVGTQNFTTKELNHATNGFSEEYKIGEGAFGEVFKGFLKRTNCAIKRLFLVSISLSTVVFTNNNFQYNLLLQYANMMWYLISFHIICKIIFMHYKKLCHWFV